MAHARARSAGAFSPRTMRSSVVQNLGDDVSGMGSSEKYHTQKRAC
jgi:hypothetical protein